MAASSTRRSSVSLDDVDGPCAPETERGGDEPDSPASLNENLVVAAVSSSRGPISPPPLRRPSGGLAGRTKPAAVLAAGTTPATAIMLDSQSDKGQSPVLGGTSCPSTSPPPPPSPPDLWAPQAVDTGTTMAQTDSNIEWTVPEIAEQLNQFRQDVKDGHSQLTAYIIESTTATERRVQHGPDLFAGAKVASVAEKKGITIRIKSKVCPSSSKEFHENQMLMSGKATSQGKEGPQGGASQRHMHQDE